MTGRTLLTRKNHRGPSLLKQIGGRSTNSLESLFRKAAVQQRKIVADQETTMNGDISLILDSDDDLSIEGSNHKDIARTTFGKAAERKNGPKTELPTRLSERVRSTARESSSVSSPSSSGKRTFEDDDENLPTNFSSQSQPSNSQLGSQHSFVLSQPKKRLRVNYGSKKSQKAPVSPWNRRSSSPEKSKQKKGFSVPPTVSTTPDIDSSPEINRTIKIYPTFDTPERPSTRATKPTLKIYEEFESPLGIKANETKATLKTFAEWDSPNESRTDKKETTKKFNAHTSPTNKIKPTKKKDTEYSEDEDDSDLPDFALQTIEAKNISRLLQKKEKEDPKRPVTRFKIYDMPEFTDDRTLQDLGLTQMDLDMAEDDSETELPDHLIQCPLCNEVVEKTFLEKFSCGERMTVAAQARFCHSHKKKSAREDWASRGYPQIDWESLNSRINQHHQYLKSLLKPNASSYYHEQMTDALKTTSKNKRSLKNIIHNGGSLAPGYYGTRGLRIMSENIMDKFTPQLRELSTKDDLMFAQGVSSFVQTVLVPELAVRLIQEDMEVTVEKARGILKESAVVGDLLQEELEEVVIRRPQEDEEDSVIY